MDSDKSEKSKKNETIKISPKDSFIPLTLLSKIVLESNIKIKTIEESDSELFFETYHGKGFIKFKNGSEYEGKVKYGIMQSSPKTKSSMKFKNGTIYIGEMSDNKITGDGQYTFSEGSVYNGKVLNGLRHGYGVYEHKEENIKYEGDWANGLKHGKGKLIIQDMIYEGNFHEGSKHNLGKLKWNQTGNYYDGMFKENYIHGNGYMVWVETQEKYIGQWKRNLQNGYGMHIWYEPKGEMKYLKNRYIGEWKNGLRHGYGVFFYSNGSRYEGLWEENLKNGFGIFTFHDGTQYIGKFSMDRMIEYNISGVYNNFDKKEIPKKAVQNSILNTSSIQAIGSNVKDRIKEVKDKENEKEKVDKIKEKDKDNKSNQNTTQNLTNLSQNIQSSSNLINVNTNSQSNKENNAKISKFRPSISTNDQNKFNTIYEDPRENFDYKKDSVKPKLDPIKVNINSSQNIEKINNNVSSIGVPIVTNSTIMNDSRISTNNNVGTKVKGTSKMESISEKDETDYNNIDQVVATRLLKESEYNPFNTMLDIADIIDSEPDIDKNIVDINNVLLRYISDLKIFYKYYSGSCKDGLDKLNDSNMLLTNLGKTDDESFKTTKEVVKMQTNNIVNKNINLKESIITEGLNINADIGYTMELKDIWKMLRDMLILSPEFTLADFNRSFYKGPRNYVEMFCIPDDLEEKDVYEFIINSSAASKELFYAKYCKNNLFQNNPNASKLPLLKYKVKEKIYEFDYHYRKNVILLRQFYEAIVRIAYISNVFDNNNNSNTNINHTSSNKSKLSLSKKLIEIIENNLKVIVKNKLGKKSTSINKDVSSLNASTIEIIYKNLETVQDMMLLSKEQDLYKAFKQLCEVSRSYVKNSDFTLTYRFFYLNILKKDQDFSKCFDKIEYVKIINKYHSTRMSITEENKSNLETLIYIENLMDLEMIFYEFCELICLVIRKYCHIFSIQEKKEEIDQVYDRLKVLIQKCEVTEKSQEAQKYYFPELEYHRSYWKLIEEKKEEEKKQLLKRKEQERCERERLKMDYYGDYDRLILIDEYEEEEYEDDDDYGN